MTKPTEVQSRKGQCLEDGDFYAYLTQAPGMQSRTDIDAHLAACGHCRRELEELLRMLHPEPGEAVKSIQEPSPTEIEDSLVLIQRSSKKDQISPPDHQWYKWGAVAAAAAVAVGLCSAGVMVLRERSQAATLYSQALASLQEVYAPQSPNDLRLDLPFREASSRRGATKEDYLASAERDLNRALGVREGMREAQLGLGYVHLHRSEFARAREAFERVLAERKEDFQALLGRGVSQFEEAISATDPAVRNARLNAALSDFENVLKLKPDSNEALFDKIRTLYELGRQKEALPDIDAYLRRDPDSIWAVKLQALKSRMLTDRSEAIDKEVYRAAKARDAPALENLVRVVPHRILPAIRSLTIDAIAFESRPNTENQPDSADLQWAAAVLASAYSNATSDTAPRRLLDFAAGLTPPQRQAKRLLDERLEALIAAYQQGHARSFFLETEPLIRGFLALGDYWELVRVHQLRESVATLKRTDFEVATRECQTMLKYAELSLDPDLIARSLSGLGYVHVLRHQYDDGLACYSRLKKVAEAHRMENWRAYALACVGNIYVGLNQLDEGMRAYSDALTSAYRLMDPITLISSLSNLAEVMEQMGRYPEGSNFYAEAWDWLNQSVANGRLKPSPELELYRLNLLNRRGCLDLQMKDPRGAEVSFREALKPPLNGMLEKEAQIHVGLASALFEQKRHREADAETNVILEILMHNDFPEIAWQVHSIKGYLLKQSGDRAGALDHFRRAQVILERMRTKVSSGRLRRTYLARRYDPFRESVALLYELKRDPLQVLEQVDRAKGITLREYLSTRLSGVGLERDSPFQTRVNSGFDIPVARTLVLEFFLTSDRILTFVSGLRGIESASYDLQLSELTGIIKQYLASIETGDARAIDSISRKLYRILIEPVASQLQIQDVESLVILPDGPLHLLPFAGLKDPHGHYLLERFNLSYAPSRSVFRYCLALGSSKRFSTKSHALLLDGRSNLSGASRELAYLSKIFGEESRLASAEDLPSLEETIGKYDIVHFSGHADIYRGQPRLVFESPRGHAYLESSLIEKWKLKNTRLVSLVGCNTGIGPLSEGEVPWGLIPAFLSAGAPALLTSLLPIDDTAAGNLATQFYYLLEHGTVTKAYALRLAQLSLLKNLGPDADARSTSWVPFVLVGDPR